MKYKHLLVTGGCGFIGSHFVSHILNTRPGVRVTCVDSLTYAAHPDTVEYLAGIAPARYSFERLDIADGEFRRFLDQSTCDAVINFAAETHVDRSIIDPASFVRTNVMGVQNLIDFVRSKPADKPVRLVHVSTDEVYGTLTPTEDPFTETTPLDPNSPYAASKAAADLLLLASQRTFKLDIAITRCSNNYGPFQFPEKLIPLVIANAIEDKSVPVYGDGKQVRDWIYVLDHCTGIERVLEAGRSGEIYNLSAHEERFNIDMVKKLLALLHKPETLIQHVGDRPAHDRRYSLNSSKARTELGWKPQFTFEDALSATVQWYLKNDTWWKKVRDKKFFEYYQANYTNKFADQRKGVTVS
jgi:dTDP-glucose 4,6-dehydratase